MAIFFFVIKVELRRKFIVGDLSTARKASLTVVAAPHISFGPLLIVGTLLLVLLANNLLRLSGIAGMHICPHYFSGMFFVLAFTVVVPDSMGSGRI